MLNYNPVSLVLKDKGWLEEDLAKDGIKLRWVLSLRSNKALEFLNAKSLDFGSPAGAAVLLARINGNPVKSIYVYSRPEWTALVTQKDSAIRTVADLIGPIATPDIVKRAPALPKNRAGKILRRILAKVAANDFQNFGDISTVSDPAIVNDIVRRRIHSLE